ncbi:MAG TPA: hypothetical protein VF478_12750 [Anaerolineae bacterium]
MQNIERKPLGIIDALSSGYALVVRRPWVLLLPIMFNLFLWLGPQINAQPIFDQAIVLLNASNPYTPNITPETQQGLDAYKEMLKTEGGSFNVFSITALFALGVPALVGSESLATAPSRPPWFVVGDIGTLIGLCILFAFVGVLIASIYLETIALAVRREGTVRTFVPRVLKSYVKTGGLIALSLFGLIALFSPFLIGAGLISLLNLGLASFVLIVGVMLVLWTLLYMTFAVPAIFVSEANPAQAIWNSITVFRFNSWSALGLVFLIYLIQQGFLLVWPLFSDTPWGTILNVIANAFLGSGLIAAAMLFYHDRFTWLTQVRQRIRQQERPIIKG